jgi:hypothetical protein
MSAPTQPQQPAKAAGTAARPARKQPRRQQQQYRRTSAVIDERPDGKPIIFGYGRHLTRREKERVQRRIAYGALGLVAVVSVLILAVTYVYGYFIYPNQVIASVNGDGITRSDRNLMANYVTVQTTSMGGSAPTDAGAQAVAQLQQQTLVRDQAKQQFGIDPTQAQITAALNKQFTGSSAGATLDQILSVTNMSKADYERLIVAPQVVQQQVSAKLTPNEPKTAEQWDYARIEVTSQISATTILKQLALKNADFAKLAKSESKDTQTSAQGGSLGWVRTTDTSIDSMLPTFLPTLKSMAKSHTKYQIFHSGSDWWVLKLIGHNLKQPLSQTQIQSDQAAAFNKWYTNIQAKAKFDPPLPAGSSTP